MNVPAVPFATVISDAAKPLTASLNVIVNVISPFVVEVALSVIVTVGAVVSTVSVCVPAALTLPAASVAVTETEFVPFAFTANVPLAGVALPVSILHEPSVAVVV